MSLKFRNGTKHTSHIGQRIGIYLYCSRFWDEFTLEVPIGITV